MSLSVGVVMRTGSGASLEQVSKTVNVEPMLVVGSQPGEVSSNVGLTWHRPARSRQLLWRLRWA